ncbi:AfsR/SARP family transcriptional regulator [Streptomyces sp. RKND-216]|uniref:AfsR/SARP family transcriptional regulator n=1 Tax=Streptomyces sp. RKND-216 TaxID=2562581 RepID=UPI00109DA9D1|nr:AfsR/SARP family transcriptional regulator [Streptomyces sp. RKND-216]THA25564.1 AfsR/SARP family transcriptional regulator [Streptomyces sp. RKND-216]
MRFQLLGPLTLTDGNDAVVLQPSKPTILLATLLLQAGSVVSAGYLQRTIWGPDQPATAKAALQTCVLRLRRLFTKHGVTETPIDAVPGGYRITADPDTLDLLAFRARVRAAAGLTDDPEAELYALQDALALWQGSLLANVPSDVLHRDEVPRLTEERLRTVERACTLELLLGRYGQALVELWSATRAFPAHERFREQLIEALYRSGRQAEALAEYRSIKGYLLDELGVDPSPALQRLELAILRGDELGAPTQPSDRAVLTRATVPGQTRGHRPGANRLALPAGAGTPLPETGTAGPPAAGVPPAGAAAGEAAESAADHAEDAAPGASTPTGSPTREQGAAPAVSEVAGVPSFAGRAAHLAAMTEHLTGVRDDPATLLVCGAPGIGKTALARQVAHLVRDRYPGGRLLVRMVGPDGAARSAEEAAAEIAAARLRRSGSVLLVFDDVVDADQVRPLLPADSDDAALVTSRRWLAGLIATHGGRVHRLDAFVPDESRELLRAVLGATRVNAEPEAADRLAAACGHFPLALRITTAWLSTRPGLPLADATDWLAEDPVGRLSLPGDSRMSVREVLTCALGRLEERCAEALLRLGSLDGADTDGFRADDAAAVLDGDAAEEAATLLDHLADAGLLEDGPPGPYRMHALVRSFARHAVRTYGTAGPHGHRPTRRHAQKV